MFSGSGGRFAPWGCPPLCSVSIDFINCFSGTLIHIHLKPLIFDFGEVVSTIVSRICPRKKRRFSSTTFIEANRCANVLSSAASNSSNEKNDLTSTIGSTSCSICLSPITDSVLWSMIAMLGSSISMSFKETEQRASCNSGANHACHVGAHGVHQQEVAAVVFQSHIV